MLLSTASIACPTLAPACIPQRAPLLPSLTFLPPFFAATNVDAIVYLMLANEMVHELLPSAITIAEDVSGGRRTARAAAQPVAGTGRPAWPAAALPCCPFQRAFVGETGWELLG